MASPPYSAVDEPLHVFKAVSIARGQLVGEAVEPDEIPADAVFEDGWAVLRLPSVYDEAELASRCFRGGDHKREPADCFSFTGSDETVDVVTLDPRYPPAYYIAVGVPARLVPDGPNAVRLMRMISVAVMAAFVASSVVSLRRLRRPSVAMVGLLVALTPMVFHLGSSVNPNGVEIAAAIALWTSGAVLMREAAVVVDRRLVLRVAVAGAVLVLSRPASPLFGLVIALALLALADRAGIRALLRSRSAQLAAVVVAAAAVAQVAWNQIVKPNYYGIPIPDTMSESDVIRFAVGKTPDYYRQMIGVFGSPDLYVNEVTIVLWSLLLGGVLFFAFAAGGRRTLLVMAGTLVASVVIPVAADVSQADRFSFAWQGRYTIPLAVGIPLLAGITVATSEPAAVLVRRRLSVAAVAIFAIAQSLAFAQFLQRYVVGVDGPLAFFVDPVWSPPVPPLVLLLGVLVGTVALGSFLLFGESDRRELSEQFVVGDPLSSAHRRTIEQHA
jgi:hypothetical protein